MQVLVTGATGFVGGGIVRRLVDDGVSVRGLIRPGGDATAVEQIGAVVARGDVTDPASLPLATDGVDAIVHLVGIIRENPKRGVTFDRIHVEGTRSILVAAKAAGVRKFIYISAMGARPDASATPYHQTKYAAEQLARESGITYTIFRPSVMIGKGGEFAKLLFDLVSNPLVPVIGSGRYRVQPMYVGDLAAYVSRALASDVLDNDTFEVEGPDVMTFDEMLRRTATVLGKKARLIHAPLGLMKMLTPLMEKTLPNPPITSGELQMMIEGTAATETRIRDIVPIQLHSLEHALQEALEP